MDEKRQERVLKLATGAVEVDTRDRGAWLEAQCGGDAALRQEVEERLAGIPGPSRPAPMGADQDLSGLRISHYLVKEKIGAGGMATVYRAEDTKLRRPVALKFIKPSRIESAEARERLLREARAVAALDHPNICTIYEIDHADGYDFIAMALLKGRTLAERLQEGPLPVVEAVDVALQTARGLGAAHAEGVVHRDIKPANLMLTTSGATRILDFGVAHVQQDQSLTEPGLRMGTAAYMSPEQIESGEVDGRADIWALGAVLYEALAGCPPFERPTSREVLAAIVGAQPPPLRDKRDDVPPALEAVIAKTLRKYPGERHASAAELCRELEIVYDELRTGERTTTGASAGVGPSSRVHRSDIWLAAAAVALAVAAAVIRFGGAAEPERTAPEPLPFTAFDGYEDHPAISPDGSRIAYLWDKQGSSGQSDLYVQLTGTYEPLRLTDTPENEHSPAWSPDGRRLAFLRSAARRRLSGFFETQLLVMPALGGPATEIAEVRTNSVHRQMDWSPVGNLVAVQDNGEIVLVDMETRAKTPLGGVDTAGFSYCPRFDPSGKRVAFLRGTPNRSTALHIVPLDGGKPQEFPVYAIDIAWIRGGAALLLANRETLNELDLRDGSLRATGLHGGYSPSMSHSMLAYTRWIYQDNIWALDTGPGASGNRPNTPVRLFSFSSSQHTPQFSPDGESIAFASNRSGNMEIWACNRDGGGVRKLTSFEGAAVGTPRWSPDGRAVAFDVALEGKERDIFTVDASGGAVRQVTRSESADFMPSWSHDGHWIYFARGDGEQRQIWKIPPEGGEAVQVTHNGASEAFESPDGTYLYYSKPLGEMTIQRLNLESGEEMAFPELGDAGALRYWALAETGIYFVSSRTDRKWIQFLHFGDRKVTNIAPIGGLTAGPGGMAVSRDGSRLLYVQRDIDNCDIMVVDNFE